MSYVIPIMFNDFVTTKGITPTADGIKISKNGAHAVTNKIAVDGDELTITFNQKSEDDDISGFRVGTIVDGKSGQGGTNCISIKGANSFNMYIHAKGGKHVQFVFYLEPGAIYNKSSIQVNDIQVIRNRNHGKVVKDEFISDKHYVSSDGFWFVGGNLFVPKAMYVDNHRTDWRIYAKQGFNLNMWAPSLHRVRMGADVGLNSMLSIGPYLWDKGWGYENGTPNRITRMLRAATEILESEFSDSLYGYYFDNEAYRQHPNEIKECIDALRQLDAERPIYFLMGNYGMAQVYSDMMDITGSYVGSVNSGGAAAGSGSTNLKALWGLRQYAPVVFGQTNGQGVHHMQGVLQAAREGLCSGVGYWADRPGHDVTKVGWWDKFPDIAKELDHAVKARFGSDPVTPVPPVQPPTIGKRTVIADLPTHRIILEEK